MGLIYQENGNLVKGVHQISWDDFVTEYGYTDQRIELIKGLEIALSQLQDCGCKKVYIDGSFVTKKVVPGDYDACWEHEGVDIDKLRRDYPLFFDFDNGRMSQKSAYKGEIFPARVPAAVNPILLFINFFQLDRDNQAKGIISLLL